VDYTTSEEEMGEERVEEEVESKAVEDKEEEVESQAKEDKEQEEEEDEDEEGESGTVSREHHPMCSPSAVINSRKYYRHWAVGTKCWRATFYPYSKCFLTQGLQ